MLMIVIMVVIRRVPLRVAVARVAMPVIVWAVRSIRLVVPAVLAVSVMIVMPAVLVVPAALIMVVRVVVLAWPAGRFAPGSILAVFAAHGPAPGWR
jgi:hypothetical protein